MGGGSTQSGNTNGQSTSTSNFSSNPLNVSNPPLYGMASDFARGMGQLLNQFTPIGTQTPYGGPLSPYSGQGPGGAYNTNNTASNPLVAPVTPQQTNLLNQINGEANPNNTNAGAYANWGATATANAAGNQPSIPGFSQQGQFANQLQGMGSNPNNFGGGTAGQAAGVAGNSANFGGGTAGNAAGYAGNASNFGGGLANAAGNFAGNPGSFGGNLANAAGGAAGSILPNAAPALSAGTNTAMNGQYGGATANQAMTQAQQSGFGTGLAGQAGQFASANQNLQPAGQALRAEMAPGFAANLAVNPLTQGVVGAAEQPIINAFNQQTVPGLQGTFAAAGQRLNSANGSGVGGSSSFDVAGANALTGLAGQLGSTAASIINPTYQTGLNIAANAPGQFAALQQQKLSGLESAASTKASTQAQQIQSLDQAALARLQVTTGKSQQELAAAAATGNLTAQESAALATASGAATGAGAAQAGALSQASQAATSAGGTQAGAIAGAAAQQTAAGAAQSGALTSASGAQTAAGQAQVGANVAGAGVAATQAAQYMQNLETSTQVSQGVSSAQLSDHINALNASALPQMTAQYGINQGISLYNSQIQQLMTMMGIGTQAAMPTIGNISMGTGTSSGTSTGTSSGKGFSIL